MKLRLFQKSSKAVGFSWGVAEEVAKGVKQLELFGFPGIESLNEYYKVINKKNFAYLSKIKKNNKTNKLFLCPINLGINFLDQIITIQKLKKITFDKIAYPILFLSFVSRSSEIIGKRIIFKFEKKNFILNFNINILSNITKNKLPFLAKKVEIIFLENKNSFKEKDWKNLYKLSKKTFVDETESSKQSAAGAGLTDND